jgi:hypothetical protein
MRFPTPGFFLLNITPGPLIHKLIRFRILYIFVCTEIFVFKQNFFVLLDNAKLDFCTGRKISF